MKTSLRILFVLAVALLGLGLFFSCEKPNINDSQGNGNGGGKKIPVENVQLDVASLGLAPGESSQLTATLLPQNATDKADIVLTWTSSAPAVASVSNSGLVTAESEGTATITVSIPSGKTAKCDVTVTLPERVSGIVGEDDFGLEGEGSEDDLNAGTQLSYKFSQKAALLPPSALDQISNVVSEGSTGVAFTLPATHDPYYGDSSCLTYGDIAVIQACPAFPGGAALKVDSIDAVDDGSSYTYHCVPAAIGEVFENLHLDMSSLDVGEIQGIEDEDGNEIEYTKTKGSDGFEIKIPDIFGDDFSASLDLGDNLTITPKMRIAFKMDMATDVVDCELTYARWRVEATADLAADLAFKAKAEKEFKSKKLTVLVGAIPIGPIVITPEIYCEFVLKLSGQVDVTFSVSYQKSVYAHAFYNGHELLSRTGEVAPSDPRDPFSVSGNLSGAIELGPNLGMAVSLYKGALGLGLDIDPHLVFTVFSSHPFSLETLKSIANNSYKTSWLMNAGYEPSISFSFGGYIQAAYVLEESFNLPEDVGLSYSFGKTYVLPSLSAPIEISTKGNSATFQTKIKNRSMYLGDMYMEIEDHKGTDNKIVPFSISGVPTNEEEVECTAVFDGMEPGEHYTARGPFMTISPFGLSIDVMMGSDSHSFYSISEPMESAMRSILKDIYNARKGDWKNCNWTDSDTPFYKLDGVSHTIDSGENVFDILVPGALGNTLSIGNRSEKVDNMMWRLWLDVDANKFDSISILDPNLEQASLRASKSITVHAPRFVSNVECPGDVDLSGTGISYFHSFYNDGKENVPVSGKVILDNCPELEFIHIGDAYHESQRLTPPASLSFLNCPKLESLYFANTDMTAVSGYTGTCKTVEVSSSNNTGAIVMDGGIDMEELIIEGQTYSGIQLSDIPSLTTVRIGHVVNGTVSVSSCPSVKTLRINRGAERVYVSDCPALEVFYVFGEGGSFDEWSGPLMDWSISGRHNLKYFAICSSHLNGTLPDFLQALVGKVSVGFSYPYKYRYEWNMDADPREKPHVVETHTNGYTMPGEPGKAFIHPLGGYLPDDYYE